jgi:hypothetical protein
MAIIHDGEIVAFYVDNEVICPVCATCEDRATGARKESFLAEELEGAIDTLWCDRCGAGILSFH